MYQLTYYLHNSGNYHVTLVDRGQTISLCPGFFRKQMEPVQLTRVIVGCLPATTELLQRLGFNDVNIQASKAI